MSRQVLATDIDEVLFPFVAEFSAWHNEQYNTDLSVDDFHTYEFNAVLKVPVPEAVHRIRAFLHQDHRHIKPLEEAQEAIAQLGNRYKLVAITARHPEFEHTTRAYLFEYFRDHVADLTLVGHRVTMDVLRTKAEVCKDFKAVALIDDSVAHVTGCAEANIQGILYGNYPWNSMDHLPESVVRCANWKEVLEFFGA